MERQSSLQETLNSIESQKEELAKSDNALAIQEVETRNAINELKSKRSDMLIVAPVSGTVHDMRINASGERVQAGEEVATIVPHLQLLAAVSVPSRISAPVKPGHSARVSVDAFPSNEFGELRGQIISISPTTNTSDDKDKDSSYRAMIAINRRLAPARFPISQLRPGMGLKAKVKLRDRAVITLVFDFLEKLTVPLTQRL
jgi:multidrug resistance efflux pump